MCYELYSCFCLFDKCCKSKYEEECYFKLLERICKKTLDKHWIIRCTENPHITEKRYVCCLRPCRRVLDNMVLSSAQDHFLMNKCLKIDFDESLLIHCYRFFVEEDKYPLYFCYECKEYFMSMYPNDFLLNRVFINDGMSHREN